MRTLTDLDADTIGALRGRGEFFWLDLHAADDAVVQELGELFAFDELAMEDSREFGQRPKVDDYGDHVLLVYYGIEGQELVEVHVYVTGEAIVTLRRGHCGTLSAAHDRLAQVDARSEEEAIYRVLDALTDSFLPRLHDLQEEVADLQDEALEYGERDIRPRILELRRRIGRIRHVVVPQLDMFAQAAGTLDRLPGLSGDEAHQYFRDIHDHLFRIAASVESSRDQLGTALELHASAVSERAGAVTERLTLIATIFLPLTFVTGFFGMNFGWMVAGIDGEGDFLLYGVGGIAASLGVLLLSFRRSGLFRR
ncbi:MAG: magnesium transporter CorA family protein [Solirubrobacterales bacterium]|nr:magnesium transporter CorA family protein [Solirubrobacterales bacterium]